MLLSLAVLGSNLDSATYQPLTCHNLFVLSVLRDRLEEIMSTSLRTLYEGKRGS